jgi:solute carrier family 44 (choline transporter-like protein), member 2/4/5
LTHGDNACVSLSLLSLLPPQKFNSLGAPWNTLASVLGLNASATVQTGKYYQLTSQVPGNGPCYPLIFNSTQWFHR